MPPKYWFSSDHHFGHDAIRKYSTRPFESVEEMNAEMLKIWNATVGPLDFVYYLGDMSLTNKNATRQILSEMNGTLFFLRGDHDKVMKGGICDRFQWVKDYYRLKLPAQGEREAMRIVLCHWPFDTWAQSHYGVWHLHGHSHGSLKTHRSGRLDVGVDAHEFKPWSLEELLEHFADEEPTEAVDHHVRRSAE